MPPIGELKRAIPCTANQLWKLSSYVARQWPLKEGKGVQVLNRSVKTMKKQTYGRFWPGMMPPWAYLWWRSRPQDLWGTVSLQIQRSLESAELRCRPLMTPNLSIQYSNLSTLNYQCSIKLSLLLSINIRTYNNPYQIHSHVAAGSWDAWTQTVD